MTKKEIRNILNLNWEKRREKIKKRQLDNTIACKDWHAKQRPPEEPKPTPSKRST